MQAINWFKNLFSSSSDPNVVVGEVKSWEKHPNADRLRIVQVNIGDKVVGPVVCGVDNFDVGDKVVLALPGAKIEQNIHSADHEPFILEKATIRGIESQGMLCAAFELGLSDTASRDDGIIVVKKDVQPGSRFEKSMVG